MTALAMIVALLMGRVELLVAGVYATPNDRYDNGQIACQGQRTDEIAMGFAHRTKACGTRALICGRRCAVGVRVDVGPFGALTKKGWRVRRRLRVGESWRGSLDLRPGLARAVGVRGVEVVTVVWLDKELTK